MQLRFSHVAFCVGLLLAADRPPSHPPPSVLIPAWLLRSTRPPTGVRPAAPLLERASPGGVLLDVNGNVWRFSIGNRGERQFTEWLGAVGRDAVGWIETRLPKLKGRELRDVAYSCRDCELVRMVAHADEHALVLCTYGAVSQLRTGAETREIITWFDALLDSFWPGRFRFALSDVASDDPL
jgi:hypothetical protein